MPRMPATTTASTLSTTTTLTGPRAAIYLRESSFEAAKPDRYGVPVQRDQCHAYCAEQGYTPVDEYLDAGEDSEELDRPEMNRLRRDIKAGQLDVVVIARYDRLARDPGLANYLVYEAEKIYGVNVEFADPDEQFEDTPFGRLKRDLKGWAKQEERRDIRKRTQAARRKRASEGKLIPGRKPPFGYVWREWQGKAKAALDEDPATAPVVRRLYADMLAGVSLRALAQALNRDRVPVPTGDPSNPGTWRPSGVHRLLRRPLYIGEYDSYHCQWEARRRLRSDGTVAKTYVMRERAHDDPARVPMPAGVVPPLVDRDTWQSVQHILDANREASPRHNSDPEATLLRGGLVVCGYCGRTMHVRRRTREPGANPNLPPIWNYACERSGVDTPCPGGKQRITAGTLDREVWGQFAQYLLQPERLHALYDGLVEQEEAHRQDGGQDALHIAKRAKSLDDEVARLSARCGQEDDPAIYATLRKRLKDVLDEREGLRALQDEAQRRYIERQARLSRRMEFVDFARKAGQMLRASDAPYALKRGLLNAFEVKVVVWHPDHAPRWAAIVGFDTLADDMLALAQGGGGTVEFRALYPGGVLSAEATQAMLRDANPAIEREIGYRLTRSGRRASVLSAVERERAWGAAVDGEEAIATLPVETDTRQSLPPIDTQSSGRCGWKSGWRGW